MNRMTDDLAEWPSDFDVDAAVRAAADDAADDGELVAVSDDEEATLATGIISHHLRTGVVSGGHVYAYDDSSFRPPFTDQYWVRVALYDRQGRRVYLGPFRDKGQSTGYGTKLHTEIVRDDGRLAARALVLWKGVNSGTHWDNWDPR
jgi:hypothetical protein